jgi:hypothetical protein
MNNDSRMAFPKKQKTNNRIVSSEEPYAHLVCSPQKQKMNNRIISSQESMLILRVLASHLRDIFDKDHARR